MQKISTARFFSWLPVLLTLLLAPLAGRAQTPQATKVSPTTNSSTFLLGSLSARKSQLLYLPSDLTGATAGNITRLYFMYGTSGQTVGNTLTNLNVRLGQTTSTTFASAGFPNFRFFNNLTPVLSSPSYTIAPGTSRQWFFIDLTTPFAYDPSQTLIVEVSFDNSSNIQFGTDGDGTFSPATQGRKLVAPNPTDSLSASTSGTWQHFGFDVQTSSGPLSAFNLLTPADNYSLTVQGSSATTFSATWQASLATSGQPVTYELLGDLPGGGFQNPVLRVPADNNGLATQATFTYHQLDSILAALNIPVGGVLTASWTVLARSGSDTLLASNPRTISFTRSTITAAAAAVAAAEASVYPNPAAGAVMLRLPQAAAGPVQLTLTDALGRVVQTQQLSGSRLAEGQQLSLAGLSTGCYIVQLQQGAERYRQLLVVQ